MSYYANRIFFTDVKRYRREASLPQKSLYWIDIILISLLAIFIILGLTGNGITLLIGRWIASKYKAENDNFPITFKEINSFSTGKRGNDWRPKFQLNNVIYIHLAISDLLGSLILPIIFIGIN